MREIRTSGSMRGSGRKALLRKRRLSLSTLPVKKSGFFLSVSQSTERIPRTLRRHIRDLL